MGPTSKVKQSKAMTGRPSKMEPIDGPEMQVTINLHCITSQKSEGLFTPFGKPEIMHDTISLKIWLLPANVENMVSS